MENVLRVLEMHVFSAVVGSCDLLCQPIRSIVSLLIFFLVPSVSLAGALKSYTIPVLLSISLFLSFNVCFIFLRYLMLDVYIVLLATSFW